MLVLMVKRSLKHIGKARVTLRQYEEKSSVFAPAWHHQCCSSQLEYEISKGHMWIILADIINAFNSLGFKKIPRAQAN